MTKLSVNINKIATLRNSRGGDNPNVIQCAMDIERFGADGITVHPRPDERHIKYSDVVELKKILTTEFNIEGNPTEEKFVKLVIDNQPTQVTLVPDATEQLTSNQGWNTIEHLDYLINIISLFKSKGIRVSIFVDPIIEMIEGAKKLAPTELSCTQNHMLKHFQLTKKKLSKPLSLQQKKRMSYS